MKRYWENEYHLFQLNETCKRAQLLNNFTAYYTTTLQYILALNICFDQNGDEEFRFGITSVP